MKNIADSPYFHALWQVLISVGVLLLMYFMYAIAKALFCGKKAQRGTRGSVTHLS